ncbi:hypothetical protein K2X33_14000 [bacterium]|nr:hypothetical protein [bacterium]
MKHCLLLLSLFFTGAAFAATPAEFNPSGDDIYRLLRVQKPYPGLDSSPGYRHSTAELVRRIKEAPDKLGQIRYLEGYWTLGLEDTLRIVYRVQELITDDVFQELYSIHLRAIDDRALYYMQDGKPVPIDEVPIAKKYLIRDVPGSGMAQLTNYEEYQHDVNSIPELAASKDVTSHIGHYDAHLRAKGIHGFAEYIHNINTSLAKTKLGIWAQFRRNWSFDRTGRWLAAPCVVLLAASGWIYHAYQGPPEVPANAPAVTQQQQVEAADKAAIETGQEAGKLFPDTLP